MRVGDTDASTKVRCPKCRSSDIQLVEIGECSLAWQVHGGRLHRNGGTFEPGQLDRVEASYKRCEHHWRVRKAIQITDVIVEDQP